MKQLVMAFASITVTAFTACAIDTEATETEGTAANFLGVKVCNAATHADATACYFSRNPGVLNGVLEIVTTFKGEHVTATIPMRSNGIGVVSGGSHFRVRASGFETSAVQPVGSKSYDEKIVLLQPCEANRRIDRSVCTTACPCSVGQGDCDTDSECATGLRCAHNVGAQYGFSPASDVCVR